MDTLQQWYSETLDGKLTFFSLGAILTTICEISALAVAAASVARLNRKQKKYEDGGGGRGGGMNMVNYNINND